MEIFYIDVGGVSVFIEREQHARRLGMQVSSANFEVWGGRYYAIASLNPSKLAAFAKTVLVAIACFGAGWFIDPPNTAQSAANHYRQKCVTSDSRYALLSDLPDPKLGTSFPLVDYNPEGKSNDR